jgi:Cu(I)/Ag(I) efflux system membrane fusion protein
MKKNLMLIIVVAVIVGFVIGRYSEHSTAMEKKPMYWVDSMQPEVHYPGPGQSSMGMELTPVYQDDSQGTDQSTDQSTVRISPVLVNNLGVRMSSVVQGTLAKRIAAVGYIEPNENKISHIHSYADGWVKKLLVNTVGEAVKKDQVLLQLYSPVLVNAQEEYLIALGAGDRSLVDASSKKLQALHISDQQIQQLKTTKKSSELVDINSPRDGVITELNIRDGMRITPDIEMMSIVDLSSIWMIAEIFEGEATWVKVGESAEARLSAYPGKVWKGEVEYVYPQVDPTTRTLKVRFRFTNPDGVLKPNMYANISLFAEPKLNVLSIPLEALIRSSEGNRVIVSLGDGRFQARSVSIGIESGDSIEILSGLKAGEMVVASGQFLIDSETNLKTGLERLDGSSKTSDTQQSSPEPEKIIEGKGIIKVLDASQHKVTLLHEPIPALNWPVMTMDFTVDNSVDLSTFKVGDHIQFILKNVTENQFITEMKKITD